MTTMTEHVIETKTHGRYLVREGDGRGLLVGFHGYGESAERHLAELEKLEGTAGWTLVAIQALNRFYNQRTGEVIASWMTKQDRELAIADNLLYVGAVLRALPSTRPIVFAGFSQGAAMAYRAAAAFDCDGLIVHGGDVPPDVSAHESVHLPPVLLGRGTSDDWYTAEKLEKDLKYLQQVTEVTTCVFEGGHEWSDELRRAGGGFLASLSSGLSSPA
jgi:predicted esterase